jgi:hypothetical protein
MLAYTTQTCEANLYNHPTQIYSSAELTNQTVILKIITIKKC